MAELISTTTAFASEGEQRAAAVLREGLPASWLVICNKVFPAKNGKSFEIDFLVIGQRWIFVIDEKSWQGPLRGNEEFWTRADGSSERSPLAKVDYVAKIVAGSAKERFAALKGGEHFVHGIVLLSSPTVQAMIHDARASKGLFRLDEVCERLLERDEQEGNPSVGQLHAELKHWLTGLRIRPPIPRHIGDTLQIEEAEQVRPKLYRCRAVEKISGTNRPRIVMLYELDHDPLEQQEAKEFYTRTYKALEKLQSTGLVSQAETPFPWADRFMVVPIVPPEGRTLSALPLPETREEFLQELQIAAKAFRGLAQIHAQGVLHRALTPAALIVQFTKGQAPRVLFSDFYAARVGGMSIAAKLDKTAVDDPYAAEDVLIGYEFATPQTDTFSLALVMLERLSGTPIASIRPTIDEKPRLPDAPRWATFLAPEQSMALTELFRSVLVPSQEEQPPSAEEVAHCLEEIVRQVQQRQVNESPQTLLNGTFVVQRLLGQGSMARTYLVSYQDFPGLGPLVLKQFLQPAEVYDHAIQEYKALDNIKSKYFPTIRQIYKPEEDAHIAMEYIPGPTLQQLEEEFPWPLERWWLFAQDLLRALDTLEERGILHRDIKPANIILHEVDHHPVLIDFGFAIRQGEERSLAGTPLYLPPEALTAASPPADSDRYAAAVVLFKVLIGQLPFAYDESGRRILRAVEELPISDEQVRRLASVLLRALDPDPTRRPASARQFLAELEQARLAAMVAVEETTPALEGGQKQEEQVNPWVEQVRGLYRRSASGNADNRGLDSDFVRRTYVPTALDRELLPLVLEQRPLALFLSGNPGDGKTAFLEQVRQQLVKQGARLVQERSDQSGWELIYNDHVFRSCYDASEAHRGLSADEQLTQKLAGLEGPERPQAALTVLVAINDGRLADYFERYGERFAWLKTQLQQARRSQSLREQDVWLVDLKRRAFVSLPGEQERSLFRRVLDSLVAKEHWAVCRNCCAEAICPIYQNAQMLRKNRTQQRLEYLLLLTHLRHQRHITMRDLRSALAYLITGNLSCHEVHAARQNEDGGASLIERSCWQSAFAPAEIDDELLRDLRVLDPARFPQPHLDRFLHFHQGPQDALLRAELMADAKDLPRQRFREERDWLAAWKRRLYFYGPRLDEDGQPYLPAVRWLDLLPYRYALLYLQLLKGEQEQLEETRRKLARGILRSDRINADLPDGHLSVVVRASEEQQLIILKQLPLEEFILEPVGTSDNEVVETLPEFLVLRHRSGTPRLEISLDLFELLLRLADGLQPEGPELQPLLEDLRHFKHAVLLMETRDLILIENGRRLHRLTQRDGKVIRTAIA
ncbi:MAG: NERD domain-containing protein [Thermogemmatispora sp.]|uniref:serine/threonine protein kinase n=1 Tax=Thermogemmatispora sp. TaxID=1968838 RepID=UPI00263279EB|nr:serine/threonine protein kinase [Thermogemmatispora sp.]MBX5455773.1 NERD domain-containing protein [Thermogemmatispora sp.]